jgi:hypothetical protein
MPLTPTPTPAQPHRSHDISRPCSPLPHPWRPPLRPLGFPSRLRGAYTGIKRLSSTPACHDKQFFFGTSAPLALATAFVELHKPRGHQIDKPAAAMTAAANAPVRKAQLQASLPRIKVRCAVELATADHGVFGRWALRFGSWASPRSVLRACRRPFSALPRHWYWPFRPFPRHWCLPPRSLNPSSLETTSLARQLHQKQGWPARFSLLPTSAPLDLSSISVPLTCSSTSADRLQHDNSSGRAGLQNVLSNTP